MLLIDALNNDVLLHIFSYLDPADLYTLRYVHPKRFLHLVHFSLRKRFKTMLLTGSECFPGLKCDLSEDDRLRIHSNWLKKNVQTKILEEDPMKCVDRFHLDTDSVYISNCGEIRRYQRSVDGGVEALHVKLGAVDDPVVSTIAICAEHLFVGTREGTCSYFRNGHRIVDNKKIHYNYRDVLAMDYSMKHVLVTANCQETNLFRVNEDSMEIVGQINRPARCLKMNATGDQLLASNISLDFETIFGEITTLSALSVYDTATLKRCDLSCCSSGVLDMAWHRSPHVLLTGHWTGDLRMFDLRTDEMTIQKVGEEDQNVSVKYDGVHGVVCGFRTSAEVCLYDLRNPRSHIRRLGTFRTPGKSSHLVDVAVDSKRLFVVNSEDIWECNYSNCN